jgi:hypothetical protein
MMPNKSEQYADEWEAAADALKAAQNMAGGPDHFAALRQVVQTRFDASKRKYPTRNSNDTYG